MNGSPGARDAQIIGRDRPASPRTPAAGRDRAPVRVSLLGGFRLTRDGVTHELARGRAASRRAAGAPPPDGASRGRGRCSRLTWSRRARSRTCARHSPACGPPASTYSEQTTRCSAWPEGVTVDTREAEAFSARLAAGAGDPGWGADHEQLLLELLPGWTDDWVPLERERFRDLSLYALDVEIRRLLDAGDRRTATTAAQEVLRVDPLRESTLRLLIEVHLAGGDDARARDCYLDFRRTLLEALGIEPSPEARALVAHLLDGDALALTRQPRHGAPGGELSRLRRERERPASTRVPWV